MTTEEKYKTVIDKNTFYFYNPIFEEKYESYISSLNETLLVLQNEIETKGLKKEIFENLLGEKENGLKALLTLTGFSRESLQRLITVVRITDNQELSKLLYKNFWEEVETEELKEWSESKMLNLVKKNEHFRKGIVNLFFEGSTVPFLAQTLPLFELKKLSISKLKFEVHAMTDTIIRYKEKGSYSGQAENNPEILIKTLLNDLEIPFQKGDLTELISHAPINKRTMDFIIPNKANPKIIIESTFLVTTSSGQGDKAKTENQIGELIKKYYPQAKFVGFVDGIAWYIRKGDMKRMVLAYDEVFTFHKDELERFKKYLKQNLK